MIGREVSIFDFDDTLVKTKSVVRLLTRRGIRKELTSRQYATYKHRKGDIYDFSDFEDVKDPILIMSVLLKLKYSINELGLNNVFILTARGNDKPIEVFLKSVGIVGIRIYALGTSDPGAKANMVYNEIKFRGATIINFFDDSFKYIRAIKSLKVIFPKVKINTMKIN